MKLIVDIPNSLYANLGKIKISSIANKRILDCVRNGTPLNDYKIQEQLQQIKEVAERYDDNDFTSQIAMRDILTILQIPEEEEK